MKINVKKSNRPMEPHSIVISKELMLQNPQPLQEQPTQEQPTQEQPTQEQPTQEQPKPEKSKEKQQVDDAHKFMEFLASGEQEEPQHHGCFAKIKDHLEHFSLEHCISGVDLYLTYNLKKVCLFGYQATKWGIFYASSLFLCLNWIFSIIALAIESRNQIKTTFFVLNILTFWLLCFSYMIKSRYQRIFETKKTFGEEKLIALSFVASVITGYFAREYISETFGKLVFWSHMSTSVIVLSAGANLILRVIYN